MALKLNATTGGGSISLDVPNSVTSDTTFTLPSTDGTNGQVLKTDASGVLSFADRGRVLQIVTGQTSTEVQSTSESMADTGLTVNITPKADDSTMLIFVNQHFYTQRSTTSSYAGFRIRKTIDGTSSNIHLPVRNSGTGGMEYGVQSGGATKAVLRSRATYILTDQPNTRLETTYFTQFAINTTGSSPFVQVNENGSLTDTTSYITVVEIAAL